jgi:hypothetical protein
MDGTAPMRATTPISRASDTWESTDNDRCCTFALPVVFLILPDFGERYVQSFKTGYFAGSRHL